MQSSTTEQTAASCLELENKTENRKFYKTTWKGHEQHAFLQMSKQDAIAASMCEVLRILPPSIPALASVDRWCLALLGLLCCRLALVDSVIVSSPHLGATYLVYDQHCVTIRPE